MIGRRRRPRAPLPPRDGVDATRVVLRTDGDSMLAALLRAPSLTDLDESALRERFAAGEIVDRHGVPVGPDTPTVTDATIHLYRDLPDEVVVPFDLPILYADDDIVVVDKPHFLATMPRGAHVVQTALVRLRRELGSDVISPAHRLDRLTAGVLLFTRRPEVRGAYQELFARRRVVKEYRAAAPADSAFTFPIDVVNRIHKDATDPRARVVDGPVNAHSRIDRVEAGDTDGDTLEYRLRPFTGRTHQLRLHMSDLGLPIHGDPLYPRPIPELAALPGRGDFSQPLRLVAHRLEFDDPLSGAHRRFVSARSVHDSGGVSIGGDR